MVAVSLLHRRGYFFQRLDVQGHQSEEPVAWPVNDFAELIDEQGHERDDQNDEVDLLAQAAA